MSKSQLRLSQLETRMAPAAGTLDPTFGVGGRATIGFPALSDNVATATAIDSLGRIIVAGIANFGFSFGSAGMILRYNSDGNLDSSFGIGGKVLSVDQPAIVDLAVDSLDRVLVAINSNNDFGIMRLTAHGTRDTSFGGTGIVTVDFGANDRAAGLALDSAGRIVVAGSSYSSEDKFAVARLKANGTLDTSFNGTGKALFGGVPGGSASALAIDSQNRVLLASSLHNGSNYDFLAVRLTSVGVLDNSFGVGGNATVNFGFEDYASDIAVDSLDRVVLTGTISIGVSGNIGVTRLTATGSLDPTFDGDGKTTLNLENVYGPDIAVDSLDRVIVLGGSSVDFPFAVTRFELNGTPDTSFNGTGMVTDAFGTTGIRDAHAVAIDAQDRIVLSGLSNPDPSPDHVDCTVGRLTKTGGRDATFGTNGLVVFNLMTGGVAYASSVAIDHLGRMIVVGTHLTNGPNLYDFAVTRFTSNGVVDKAFGVDGRVTIDLGGYDEGMAVAVDSFNRIVVAGYSQIDVPTVHFVCAVARLTDTGALDSSFDGDGKLTFDFTPSDSGYLQTVSVDSQDRVLVAGSVYNNTAVARLTTSGGFDTSFNGDGKSIISYGADFSTACSIAVDSLDRPVVASRLFTAASSIDGFGVARLTASGGLDTSFDGDGKVTFGFGSQLAETSAVTVDSSDRVIVAGRYYDGVQNLFAVARLTGDGLLDSSFDGDGKVTFAFGPNDQAATGVGVDAFDRVIVAGNADNLMGGTDCAVARLLTNGSFDPSFDSDGTATFGFGSFYEQVSGVAIDAAGRPVVAGITLQYGYEFAIARLTGDTATATVQVNDGSAQRSMVTSFKVTFSEPVTFPSGINAAFQLQRTGPDTPNGLVNLQCVQSANTVMVTFNDPIYVPGIVKSLIDGNYKLTLVADKISSASGFLDGDLNGLPGGDLVFNTHRLFGDGDGIGRVDSDDFSLLRQCFGTSLNLAFDFGGDGMVDADDFFEFRKRFGLNLIP